MAIGSLIGDAFGGITNRLQQGFSGIKERFDQPNPADPKYQNDPEKYWTDYINWHGNKNLLSQGISGIPQYQPDFRQRAFKGGRRPTQYASLPAGPQVSPVAGLYLDPRRRG